MLQGLDFFAFEGYVLVEALDFRHAEVEPVLVLCNPTGGIGQFLDPHSQFLVLSRDKLNLGLILPHSAMLYLADPSLIGATFLFHLSHSRLQSVHFVHLTLQQPVKSFNLAAEEHHLALVIVCEVAVGGVGVVELANQRVVLLLDCPQS